jgi:tRNA(fMet)-specific endonuclease VapC
VRFLLDTNIVSDLIRNPNGRAGTRLANVGQHSVCTSIIVAAELRYGAAKKASPDLSRRIEAMLHRLDVVPLEAPVDAVYAGLRARLEEMGLPIGGNDLFIAAHALALGCTLVSGNEREFSRVAHLRFENWLAE